MDGERGGQAGLRQGCGVPGQRPVHMAGGPVPGGQPTHRDPQAMPHDGEKARAARGGQLRATHGRRPRPRRATYPQGPPGHATRRRESQSSKRRAAESRASPPDMGLELRSHRRLCFPLSRPRRVPLPTPVYKQDLEEVSWAGPLLVTAELGPSPRGSQVRGLSRPALTPKVPV